MPVTKEYAGALVLFLREVLTREISYKYERGEDGIYYCWTDEMPGLFGEGLTLSDAESDMLDTLTEGAREYVRMMREGIDVDSDRVGLIMQVLLTGKEVLKSCLHGRNCDDI